MKTSPTPGPDVEACPTLRLAHGQLATVDMCNCGMLRLHLGAITLRLTPDALESNLDTFVEALHTHATLGGGGALQQTAPTRGPGAVGLARGQS
jgi:hypothetical protein